MHQMPFVNIIGIGTGQIKTITREAEEIINNSVCLIGDKRVLKPFEGFNIPLFYSSNIAEIRQHLAGFGEADQVAVLVSGDVGFYSLAKLLVDRCEPKEKIKLICGISSLQYFCAKHQIPWQEVKVLSLHGRDGKVINSVMNNQRVFILTGGKKTPAEVCKQLCQAGLETVKVSVGENLSYPEERITTGTAKTLSEMTFADLAVMLVWSDQSLKKEFVTHGLPDTHFIRGQVPMTKQEVRSVVLSKLQLTSGDTVYDIGAGTGSVAIEMALQVTAGSVYAIERNPEAIEILYKNKQKFFAYHLQIIQAVAPDGIEDLPDPDKVFIGGSGGNLPEILNTLYARNPQVRVVITAITLETLQEAVGYYKGRPDLDVEVIQVAVSKARKLGDYHLLTGQNPVFVITAEATTPKCIRKRVGK